MSAAARARVIATALAAGADRVRIAPARAQPQTQARLAAAFERGDLAAWPYDAAYAERAARPQALLEGAQSVVCIALGYRTETPPERHGAGRVSNYAWAPDYHRRMRSILEVIVQAIEQTGERAVAACDTAPLAERAFAEAAGLGWIGKHTNLIVPGLGSTVFLGEVVTSLDLAPDAPIRTTCGSCRRCITACPTGALRGDYTIDATRCISDLTQRAGSLPHALRPLIGTWVWGCDLCGDACPPTRRGARADARFEPLAHELAAPRLQDLVRLRAGTFKRWFAKTAMGWRGAALLRRNAAIALGNQLDRADVPVLAQVLGNDAHVLVRGAAAWALGRIGSPAAYALLAAALGAEEEPAVEAEIRLALEPRSGSAALG